MEKIAIIILNWNGKENTLDCLKSIDKSQKILVVDNNSTDDSVEIIKKEFPEVKIIQNPQNYGFAKGNNIGIKKALSDGAEYVFILNNDTVLEKNCLKNLLEAVKKYQEYSIFAPKIYFEKNYEFHKDRYSDNEKGRVIWYAGGIIDWKNVYGKHRGVDEVDCGQFDKFESTEYATGAAMFVKKEVFEKIGLLDEKYFMYYEDTDFCIRAKKAGFKILFVPNAVVYHKNAGSSSSGSHLQDYYITRNRLMFGIKYAKLKTKLVLIRELFPKVFHDFVYRHR